jgi:hypothetical protein
MGKQWIRDTLIRLPGLQFCGRRAMNAKHGWWVKFHTKYMIDPILGFFFFNY